MENNELNNLLTILNRANNCAKALFILESIRENGLFTWDLKEIESREWVKDIKAQKWIAHMKEKIDEAIVVYKKIHSNAAIARHHQVSKAFGGGL